LGRLDNGVVSATPMRRLVAAVVAAAALPLVGCDDTRSADLDHGTSTETVDRESLASDVLRDLETAVRRRDGAVARATAATPAAGDELGVLVGNARRLDLRDVSLQLLSDSATALTPPQRERWGDEAWVADVQVAWRYHGVDRTSSVLTVPFAFQARDGQGFLTAALPQAERVPLWLSGRVEVARAGRAVAVTARGHDASTYLTYARRAVRTVGRSLPAWRGVLCVEVPTDQGSFREVSGISPQQAAAIAAVTTTPDGSTQEGAVQHVYVNPRLFEPLSAEGRQIVVSHEAAHVALGAALLDVPMWLSEGVADHVALADSSTPVATLAAQILRQTRNDGPPRALPGERAFDGSDKRIGAWYEAAWLAVRLIASTYGEDAMWRFYRQSVRDKGTRAAFRDVLGTSQQEFVQAWRAHLVSLAG
jgi:hypothetical protein